jgi:hypothetical protein
MKSIKEWMREKGMINEEGDINASNFARFMGGQSFDVDAHLKTLLRQKVESILQMDEFKDKSKSEMLKAFTAAIGAIEAEMSGSTASASKMVGRLGDSQGKQNDPADQVAQEVGR